MDFSHRRRDPEVRAKRRRSSDNTVERRGGQGGSGGGQVWSKEMDGMLEVLIKDTGMSVLSVAIERILQKQSPDNAKVDFLEKSLALGCQLQHVASKLTREHGTHHNSVAWPLTQDLTVKVFSLLGTQSLCYAAATCTMFNKLAMDPACYVDIDLTTRGGPNNVSNRTVNKVVQRAGKCLRSLKLGILPRQNRLPGLETPRLFIGKLRDSPPRSGVTPDKVVTLRSTSHDCDPLTKTCLESLSSDHGVAGAMLKTLHVFNMDHMDSKYLCRAIAACPSLTDLEVVGLYISIRSLMECLGTYCPKLERLCCQPGKSSGLGGWGSSSPESVKGGACNHLVKGCPGISCLALRNYLIADHRANILLKGLPKLTLIDFSGANKLTGVFLRGIVGRGEQGSFLETLLLRDCVRLREVEVERFMCMLITGECKNLRHLDVSNKDGLAGRDWFDRRLSPSTEQAILRVRQERPELCLLDDFPDQKSSSDSDSLNSSFDDSDDSGPARINSSDYLSSTSMSDSTDDDEDDNDSDSGFSCHEEVLAYQGEKADSDMSLLSKHSDGLEDLDVFSDREQADSDMSLLSNHSLEDLDVFLDNESGHDLTVD